MGENEALHTEVAQLTQQVRDHDSRQERDRHHFCMTISEMEQQLQSMAVGYEQVEQASEMLKRDNEKLVVSLEAAERIRGQSGVGAIAKSADRCLDLEREV